LQTLSAKCNVRTGPVKLEKVSDIVELAASFVTCLKYLRRKEE